MTFEDLPKREERSRTVQTVLGPVSTRELGITLTHEHLVVNLFSYWDPDSDPEIALRSPSLEILGRIRASPFACRENLHIGPTHSLPAVDEFRKAGGATLVDLTCSAAIGRDPRALQLISRATDVNVIASTGYYLEPTVPPAVRELGIEELVDGFVDEATNGINGTGIIPGVIGEIGVGHFPMTKWERRLLDAALQAGYTLGLPVFVHPAHGDDSIMEISEFVLESRTPPAQVVLCHADVRLHSSLDRLVELAAHQFYIGLDTFGRETYYAVLQDQLPQDEARIRMISDLKDHGLLDRVLPAHDICFRHEYAQLGGHGLAHLLRTLPERFASKGLTTDDLSTLLVDNPRSLFE